MPYQFKNIREFQEKHPGREEREKILKDLPEEEVRHLASTCGNTTTAACFWTFASRVRKTRDDTETRESAKEREESGT